MNKSPIGWTQFTWNPIFGCYGPGGTAKNPKRCWYCYAEQFAKRRLNNCIDCFLFIPHMCPERIYEPLQRKKPTTIFVGSMSDMWGDWVPAEWIEAVLQVIRACPQHTFLALTKNPDRYHDFKLPVENLWLGTTVTNAKDYGRRAVVDLIRVRSIDCEKPRYKGPEPKLFLSAEPMLGDILAEPQGARCDWYLHKFDAVIIGPLNKRGHDPVTKREWVERIIEIADSAGVPVFLKNALHEKGIMTEAEVEKRQQTPWNL